MHRLLLHIIIYASLQYSFHHTVHASASPAEIQNNNNHCAVKGTSYT